MTEIILKAENIKLSVKNNFLPKYITSGQVISPLALIFWVHDFPLHKKNLLAMQMGNTGSLGGT